MATYRPNAIGNYTTMPRSEYIPWEEQKSPAEYGFNPARAQMVQNSHNSLAGLLQGYNRQPVYNRFAYQAPMQNMVARTAAAPQPMSKGGGNRMVQQQSQPTPNPTSKASRRQTQTTPNSGTPLAYPKGYQAPRDSEYSANPAPNPMSKGG